MTALTQDLSLTGDIVNVDGPLIVGEFYHLQDEVVLVRGSVSQTYGDITARNRWRVSRGQDHTNAATHSSGTTVTVAREFESSGAGGGAIAVTDGVTTVAAATEIEVVGADVTDAGGGVAQIGYVKTIILDTGEQFVIQSNESFDSLEFIPNGTHRLTLSSAVDGGPAAYVISVSNSTDVVEFGEVAGVPSLSVLGNVGFYGTSPIAQPIVPLTTPDVQDVIDALVLLGLVTQSD